MAKKYNVQFLGDKQICLETKDTTREQRVELCNEFIRTIANGDPNRDYFMRKRDGNIAKFDIVGGELIYFDHYTNLPIFHTIQENKSKWKGNFNGGGTLQNLVMCMSIFIECGIPFFYWETRIQHWGYAPDAIAAVKNKGLELGIFTETARYMFLQQTKESVEAYLESNPNIDRNKCLCVDPQEPHDKRPYWLNECNFIYSSTR